MKKKLLSILLCTTMIASLAVGCGGKEEETESTETTETTKLTFWTNSNEPWVASYKEIAANFEKEHPEYEVEVTTIPGSDWGQKIQTALTDDSGDGPDIITVWGGSAPSYIESDGLAAVPDDFAAEMREDYLEPTLGIYEKEGTFYGVPMEFNLEYGGMIVNKTLFDENNLTYPETWEELRSLSQEVSVKDEGSDIVEMAGFEMIDSDAFICNFLAMILQQGGEYIQDDNSVNFATEEGVKALEEILSMVDNGECDLDGLTNMDFCYNDVYQNKAYMASVGSWAIAEGPATYELTYGEDYEYIPVPQYGEEMAFASETGWGLIVPANSENVDAAWEFVEFFSQPENLVKHNIACAQLPPRKSLLDSEEYIEAMPQVEFLLDILPYGKWMGPYNTSEMRTVLDEMFINLAQLDPAERDLEGALKAASEEISETCVLSYSTK